MLYLSLPSSPPLFTYTLAISQESMRPTLLEMHEAKEEEGGEWFHKNKSETGYQNHLELRLGVSPTNSSNKYNNNSFPDPVRATGREAQGVCAAAGSKLIRSMTTFDEFIPSRGTTTFWPESAAGFIHPWSLAARQQKAAFEQAQRNSNPSFSTVPRFTAPPPPPVVGWPPVHAFRRNFVPTMSEMDGERDAKRLKVQEDQKSAPETKPALFVKVNMEGFSVGRKINLKAHDSYESLSHAFKKMFNNFLSANYSTNASEEQDGSSDLDYILLYEDHEGDRMLIGDVPWEMFITTAKRLYIARNPKIVKHDNGNDVTDNGKEADVGVDH